MKLGFRQLINDLHNRRYRFRQIIGVVFMLFIALRSDPIHLLLWFGIGVAGMGACIRLWAAGYIRKSKELETLGPYSFVRHPQYLGNTLIALGICLAAGHPFAIIGWGLILYLFYLPAIKREDNKLHSRFGEEWEAWNAKTPAIFPAEFQKIRTGIADLKYWSIVRAVKNGEIIWATLFLGIILFILAGADNVILFWKRG